MLCDEFDAASVKLVCREYWICTFVCVLVSLI